MKLIQQMKKLLFLVVFVGISSTTYAQCGDMLIVLINTYDQLYVENEILPMNKLKDKVKLFIANPDNDDVNSQKEMKRIKYLGDIMVSRGIIFIQCDRGTSYQAYINVQNEVDRAFNELRNELSMQVFKTPYKDLDFDRKMAVYYAIPEVLCEPELKDVGNLK